MYAVERLFAKQNFAQRAVQSLVCSIVFVFVAKQVGRTQTDYSRGWGLTKLGSL